MIPMTSTTQMLKAAHLKDTQPRRLVTEALERIERPVSAADLGRWLTGQRKPLNAVTVYRVMEALERADIVHRHPCNGLYSLCTLPDEKGHHGFLHCRACDRVEEFSSASLCDVEHGIAARAGFTPATHVSEITGTCKKCRA
jgi:Fur family zinc uptake transcriptional regulator